MESNNESDNINEFKQTGRIGRRNAIPNLELTLNDNLALETTHLSTQMININLKEDKTTENQEQKQMEQKEQQT